ncbi:LysM peptidoglycan-binding domain-containing protein, partial [Blastococcus sp. KM273129]|uniref:LysM peptidoglycan-binding domain-containing protein n=1 Tax=Blastococcus sp. KM273129 TaxID=2570315 RepID=UPI001F2DC37D
MSVRRLLGTGAGMGGAAVVLAVLAPAPAASLSALAAAQRTADTAGPDVLVAHLVGVLAWAVWGWGALGLALTAGSALPGANGALAARALRGVLPSGARRAAALVLGLGLGIAPPLPGAVLPGPPAAPAAAAEEVPAPPTPSSAVPDWPPAPAPPPDAAARTVPVPDRPPATAPGEHVVLRGECLWRIAEDHLAGTRGRTPSDAEVASAVTAWWHANAEVIGPDPDLLLPGQVLRP